MSDETPDPYGDLVRRVVADQIEPEAAALEAMGLMDQLRGDAMLTGFSLSFLGLSEVEAERLARFAQAIEELVMRRAASEPDSG